MDTLQHDLPNLEAQIPPIHEQFAILEKYEVPVPDSVSTSSVSFTRVGPPQQPQTVGNPCSAGEGSRDMKEGESFRLKRH